MSIANIPPKGRIEVEIGYQQAVTHLDGRYSLRFPMAVTPRYLPAPSEFTGFKSGGGNGERLNFLIRSVDAPRSNRDVVCVAEADYDVRNQVRRHYEIGKGAQDDGFYTQRGFTVARTIICGDRFLREGNHANGAAHFLPETTFHGALAAFHPVHIETGCVFFRHFLLIGTLPRLCYTGS